MSRSRALAGGLRLRAGWRNGYEPKGVLRQDYCSWCRAAWDQGAVTFQAGGAIREGAPSGGAGTWGVRAGVVRSAAE